MRLTVICAVIGMLAAGAARAQDEAAIPTSTQPLPEFDCARLVMSTGAGNPAGRREQLLGDEYGPRIWRSQNDVKNRAQGPIALIEKLNDGRDLFMMEDAPPLPLRLEDGVTGHLGCLLQVIEFKIGDLGREGDVMSYVGFSGRFSQEARVPVLFLAFLDTPLEHQANLGSYISRPSFSIEVPDFSPAAEDERRRLEATYFRSHSYFPEVGQFDNNTARVVPFVSMDGENRLTTEVKDFLKQNGVEVHELLVFCGGAPCEDIYKAVAQEEENNGSAVTRTLDRLSTDRPRGSVVVIEDHTVNRPPASPSEGETLPIDVPAEQGVAQVPGFEAGVLLNFVDSDGQILQNATNSISSSGGLECILSALVPELFMNDPSRDFACDQRFSTGLAQRQVGLRVNSSGNWSLVVGGRALPPESIFVELPPGVTGEGCTPSLYLSFVEDEGGGDRTIQEVKWPMAQVQGRIPVTYQSASSVGSFTPLVEDGLVRFEIEVNSEAECGGPGRIVEVATAPRLTVQLVEGETTNRFVAHIATSNANLREDAFNMGDNWDERFGGAILNAVAAAHFEVGQRRGDEPWELTRAVVSVLDGAGISNLLLEIRPTPLREGAAREFRDVEARGAATDIGRATYNISGRSLVSALEDLRTISAGSGAEELVVTLLAPFVGGSAEVPAAPCAQSEFLSLLDLLALDDLPQLRIVVFPVVGIRERDQTDSNGMVPVGFQDPASGGMGGMYRCIGLPEGLEIYPFYVEPWRSQATIPARYSAALSEQLSRLLSDIVN